MAYDKQDELKKVKEYYEGDHLQKRFSALITGETNTGKTFLLRTARKPIHIDSFDPGGTKCLEAYIRKGDIVVDTRFENEDPEDPSAFAEWMKAVEMRLHIGYYNQFATVVVDSATTFGDAVMNNQLQAAGDAGGVPKWNRDYTIQKLNMQKYIRKLMNIPCDFILTGHLRENKKLLYVDPKTGISKEEVTYRFFTTGQAVVTIPLLFDEIYVIKMEGRGGVDPKRIMLIDSLGEYMARSRLKADGKLSATEPPDIKAILKKAGISTKDKPKLEGGE